ncbi:MAG: GHKL domain-containing protein [Candidatus Syntrophopropionicum ammoniitolerans]
MLAFIVSRGAGIESYLCMVVGNLMENTVETCKCMAGGKQFICVNS